VLKTSCEQLKELGYDIVSVDASGWHIQGALHSDIAAALDFPEYYGRNLNALRDCLRDVAECSYGAREDAAGLVLTISRFDVLATHDLGAAEGVLDAFTDAARTALLFGHRMLLLLQSDDPELEIPPVGSTSVRWNPAERLRSKREA
jgi:hypothetical protein